MPTYAVAQVGQKISNDLINLKYWFVFIQIEFLVYEKFANLKELKMINDYGPAVRIRNIYQVYVMLPVWNSFSG